ncbi:MAG TPA: ABC transporter permease subunit [Gemmatimonadales bacterium]
MTSAPQLHRTRRFGLVDLAIVVALAGLLFGVLQLGREWSGASRPAMVIDLSPWALPRYTFYSLSRGLLAYVLSLAFTLSYGYWAAKDRLAERVLVPLLDILQSIPVLGFMPGLILALVALFPHSNIGLELAAVIMIFTGQAWNMTFSYYHSLRSVPDDLSEVGAVYRFSWWQRLKWLELPYATLGLVWNSMLSMAGGWFFLMINEAFRLGDRDFRLPGIGSYMSVAVDQGRTDAMIYAIGAMTLMIVAVDQVLWRPIVVWAQKFRVDEGGTQERTTSWFLNLLRRSRLIAVLRRLWRRLRTRLARRRIPRPGPGPTVEQVAVRRPAPWLGVILLALLLAALAFGAWKLTHVLRRVPAAEWGTLGSAAGWTLGRVLLATALGTLWALPAGIAIGLSPRLSGLLQPVVQIVASFPAPMLFPIVIAGLAAAGVSLGWGSIVLMLLGTQWYILFNVIAGAMAIPTDLQEAARSYRLRGWRRFRALYLPGVFPYLVTGWVTAAGGAWNASIVAEYVTFKGQTLQAHGLGAQISAAAAAADFPRLAASILVMSAIVVAFNRTVWRQCYRFAESRFSLNR